jgi:hypothetical protein
MVLYNLTFTLALFLTISFIKYVLKKKISLFQLLIAISILPVLSTFRSGTYNAGDLTLHTAYLYSFFDNLKNGVLIPQWAEHLCGGYGCPVFMFEYTTPFYIASFFHLIGFSYLTSMKLFLASAYIASGVTMYLFVKNDYCDESAFTAALIYLFAPIRFIEMHFRTSVGTDAAFIFIPLAFLFAKKVLKGRPIYITLTAVNILLLLLSHSSTSLVVIPLSAVYAFLKRKNIRQMMYVLVAFVLGFGISAWYILPALFELKYTWYYIGITNAKYVFLPIIDTIYSHTYLGLLYQGRHGESWPVIGYSTIIVIVVSIYYLLKSKYLRHEKTITIFFLSSFFILFFMMLPPSKFLWENVFFLKSFIIYWRVLVPITFITGYLGAVAAGHLNKKHLIAFCLFTVFSTILNWGNRDMVPFDPKRYFNQRVLYTEYYEPHNPVLLERYKTRFPITDSIVQQKPKAHLEILSGRGSMQETYRNPIDHRYLVQADTDLLLSENTYYFPGWRIYANGEGVPVIHDNSLKFGTNVFNLKRGSYKIRVVFEDTRVRKLGKVLSLLSLSILGFYMLFKNPPAIPDKHS